MYHYDLLLLRVPPSAGLFETVNKADLPIYVVIRGDLIRIIGSASSSDAPNLAHTTTSLLFLQVLRAKIARLGIQDHGRADLLRGLLQALLVATNAPTR